MDATDNLAADDHCIDTMQDKWFPEASLTNMV